MDGPVQAKILCPACKRWVKASDAIVKQEKTETVANETE